MTDPTPTDTPAKKRTRATKSQAAEKRLRAFRMLRAGADWETIAHECDYNSPQAAWKAVNSYLNRQTAIEADDYRKLLKARLEGYLAALSSGIGKGDVQSVNSAVKIVERLSRLMGLDAPAAVDITTKGERIEAYDYGNAIAAITTRPDSDSRTPREDKSY